MCMSENCTTEIRKSQETSVYELFKLIFNFSPYHPPFVVIWLFWPSVLGHFIFGNFRESSVHILKSSCTILFGSNLKLTLVSLHVHRHGQNQTGSQSRCQFSVPRSTLDRWPSTYYVSKKVGGWGWPIWQYRLLSFQERDTKLERFLAKNQL